MKNLLLAMTLVLTQTQAFAVGTPESMIVSLSAGAVEECPIMVTENSATYCASFSFVDRFLQIPTLNAINSQASMVRIFGNWGKRMTESGKKAPLFIIKYVTAE